MSRDQREFSVEDRHRYRAIEAASSPSFGFWSGYAYVDAEAYDDSDETGLIRLYSPQGSAKWAFLVKDGFIKIWFA
jgi:hypothetical protein